MSEDTTSEPNQPTTDDYKAHFSDLGTDLIVTFSLLFAACIILLAAVIGLYVWNYHLHKRQKQFSEDPLGNFKLSRPRLRNDHEDRSPPQPHQNSYGYDNPAMHQGHDRDRNNPLARNQPAPFPARNTNEPFPSRNPNESFPNLNPISNRRQNSINNDNFSYGNNFVSDRDDSYRNNKPTSILSRESKYY